MSVQLTKDEAKKSKTVLRILDALTRVSGETQVHSYAVFIYVAQNAGCSVQDVAERFGFAISTASRNVALLSAEKKYKVPGLGLVVNDTDPMDRRRRVLTLTQKGRALVRELLDIVE